jgi:MFS family permease
MTLVELKGHDCLLFCSGSSLSIKGSEVIMQDHSLKLQLSLLAFVLLTAIDATSIIFAVPVSYMYTAAMEAYENSQYITVDLSGDATQGFWISASFLLASCISVPLTSHLSGFFERKNAVLSSALLLGVGSLLGDHAESMGTLLVGRSIQGFGAGGLVMLAYAVYGDLEHSQSAPRFLRGLTCSIAVGTACGPFIGAALSDNGLWVGESCSDLLS